MKTCTLGDCQLLCGDALAVLPTLPAASVQLVVVDPPYMNVKPEAWDRQWRTRAAYLDWLRALAQEWRRVLKPNGSLYCFASPQMAAWVEVTLSETFNILQRIQWLKRDGWHKKALPDALQLYLSPREEIIFVEQYGSDLPYQDSLVTENGSYWTACERLKTTLFGAVIREAMEGTHTSAKEVTEAIGAYSKVNHGGAVSNWLSGANIPTKAQYDALRVFFNSRNGQYDYLRREYEDLRRPFTVSAQVPYTDVWNFATVPAGPGKHPAEKPLPLLRHMIEVSSRPGDTVLDCCMGSGSTLEAAKQMGRRTIGIEQDTHWYGRACSCLAQEWLFLLLVILLLTTSAHAQTVLLWEYPRELSPEFFLLTAASSGGTLHWRTAPAEEGACLGPASPETYCTHLPTCPTLGAVMLSVVAIVSGEPSGPSVPPLRCQVRAQSPCQVQCEGQAEGAPGGLAAGEVPTVGAPADMFETEDGRVVFEVPDAPTHDPATLPPVIAAAEVPLFQPAPIESPL